MRAFLVTLAKELEDSTGCTVDIHMTDGYPTVTNDPELERMRSLVASILRVKDERLSIHDFRMVPGKGHTNLIFDVSLPSDLMGQEKQLQSALEAALQGLGQGKFYTVITFDQAAFNG